MYHSGVQSTAKAIEMCIIIIIIFYFEDKYIKPNIIIEKKFDSAG